MATIQRVMSHTQKKIQDIKKKKEELDRELEKQVFLSEIECIIRNKPEYIKDIKELLNIMDYVEEDILKEVVELEIVDNFEDALESEDRVDSPISIEINDGPINDEECDEVIDDRVFSNDGLTSNKEIINILREKEFIVKESNGKIRNHSIKKKGCKKKLCIENHITKNINEYIITTNNETNNSSHVLTWNKFCNKSNSDRRKYEFKGKNIVEVITMIDNILS